MPHNLRSTALGVPPAVEARGDGGHDGVQSGEKPVVCRHAAGELPDALDGGQLRTVR